MIDEKGLTALRQRIAAAAAKSGRSPADIELLAVSKTRTRDEVLQAVALGLTHFGENRVAEAREKFQGLPGVTVDLIGHLQTNKVKKSLPFFRTIQSVDSLRLAVLLSAEAVRQGVIQSVFLEQNCSGEASKSGFASFDELCRGAEAIRQLPALQIEGLMTVGPLISEEGAVRRAFQRLRFSFEHLRTEEGLSSLKTLSMGMSHDFEWAIEEGSNHIRIGTLLFGEREYGV